MANKDRNKRSARKARQAQRAQAQATKEAQLAASEQNKKGVKAPFAADSSSQSKSSQKKRGSLFKGSTKETKGSTKETSAATSAKKSAQEAKSALDHPLTKAEKKEAKRAAAKAKKQEKIQKRRDKKLSVLDKKIAAAKKEVQKTKVIQDKTARELAEEKAKGTPSKKTVKAAAMAEVRADEALGRAAKLEQKKKNKAKSQSLWRRFLTNLSNIKSEMKRVAWPTRKELRNYTIAVIVLLVIFGLVVWAIDLGVSGGIIQNIDHLRGLIGG